MDEELDGLKVIAGDIGGLFLVSQYIAATRYCVQLR
jgi:hypothetical protein